MKLKIALFGESDEVNYLCVFPQSTAAFTELIRKSAWVEVDFPEREDSPDAIQEEVSRIDLEIEAVIERNVSQLKQLKAKKTAVLSQVFKPEVVE